MSIYTQQNHAAPLARSGSFFGTIKNIVTAPFAWFAGSDDEFEDTNGKRRRSPVASEDARMDDGALPSRPKRMRVSSPERETHPYLDPPRSAFTQPRRTADRPLHALARDVSRSPRKTLHVLSSSNHLLRNRRTLSPLPSGSHLKPQGATRTMSLDPPSHSGLSSRLQAVPTILDLQSESDHAGETTSTGRDVSMSPRHLRVRSSLTPQPSGTGFGPVVPLPRERGPDEPPPLAALMSNPMFVKPPPAAQKPAAAELPRQLTLGTLIDSQRTARVPSRQSSILFGTGSMTDVSAPGHLWPVNKAEIALHELEVYKTPLLPTRLKGATAVPDMFLHKEKKHITLMTDDRPAKPRLGTKGKGKEKGKRKERESTNAANGTKPYAGEGGMKRWLARRRREEVEAKEKERAEAMEDERAEEKERREAEAEQKKREELKVPPPPPAAPVFEPRAPREGPLSSSLRVGRTRLGRNHIERPVSRRTKFSAAFEDEDEDMEESRVAEQKVLEEAAKKAPVFEIPEGFTFAKEAAIKHDLVNAKEPPIVSLPFSLTKPTPAPPAADAIKVAPTPVLAPAPLKISIVPPTPEAIKVVSEAPAPPVTVPPPSSTAPTGIPNFFVNSSVFAKAPILTTPPPSFPAPIPAMEQPKVSTVPELQVPKPADATPSPFGAPSRPVSTLAPPTDPVAIASTLAAPPALPKESEKPAMSAPPLASPFTLGATAKPVESAPTSTPSASSQRPPAAEPAKPPTASSGSPFTFGAPSPAPSPAPAAIPPPVAPVATIETPKSVFPFGQPAPTTTTTSAPAPGITPIAETPKSLFGTPPPVTPFSFGQRPSTATTEEKSAANTFSFGAPSATEKKPTTGFSFGPSTTSTVVAAAPAAFSFDTTPLATTAADVSNKSFAFGSATSTRPVTPPKAVQEVTMDESPARDMALNGNGKAPERPILDFSFSTPSRSALFAQSPATTTAPFSFGAPSVSANPFAKEEKKETKLAVSFAGFGQASSTGFSFGQKPPESPATTAPASAAFQFGQLSPCVAPTSPFPFGTAPTSGTTFGQPSTGSAPSSPSTFNRPATFTFGTPTTQPAANPFAFGTGSQPASPAAGSTALPGTTSSTAFAFGAGANAAAAPTVGFGVPAPAAAPGGGSLFTMGSAPPPADGVGGRRIKGLPRRGGRRP